MEALVIVIALDGMAIALALILIAFEISKLKDK